MGPAEVAAILFGTFIVLVFLRVPVAFALGLAVVPVFFIEERLTPVLLMREMFKSYNAFVLLAVPFFLLAANLMNAAGITDRLIRLARAMVGHLPGGLGHVNVVVSMLFAGISGSSSADVVPGLLIAGSQMLTVYIYAKRRGYPIYQRSTFVELMKAAAGASLALMTPLIIVGGIVGGFFTPTEASVVAVLYSLIIGVFVYRSIEIRALPSILYDSARFSAITLFCIGTASAFGWCLAYFKIPAALVAQIEILGFGVVGTGIMVALSFLIIGMFIDAIPAIIILGTVLFPVVQHVGMHPIHFAIIGVVSLGFGLVTPPYGLCLLITAAIGKIRLVDALRDVIVILLPMIGVRGLFERCIYLDTVLRPSQRLRHRSVLCPLGLINASEIEERATSALTAFIGGQLMVKLNIDQAVADARAFEL